MKDEQIIASDAGTHEFNVYPTVEYILIDVVHHFRELKSSNIYIYRQFKVFTNFTTDYALAICFSSPRDVSL